MNSTRIAQPGRLGQPWVREVIPGVFRIGTTFLGCYAVEDAGAYTFIDDRAAAMRKGRPPLYPLWKPPVLHLVGHFLRNGVARTAPVAEASGFADEEVLDVPGRPRVIHTPGHTAGNVVLSLADRDVLIVGDTLATLSLSHGESGPQLLPRFMNDDHDRALACGKRSSRSRLAGSCRPMVFPGREARSRPSSWPGRSRPGQADSPAAPT